MVFSIQGWFERLSSAWQSVLAQPDGALGLRPARGRKEAGHYRGVLMGLLTEWETEVNQIIEDQSLNEEVEEDGKKACLTATTPKAPAASSRKKSKAPSPPSPPSSKKRAAAAAASSSSSSGKGKRRRGQ